MILTSLCVPPVPVLPATGRLLWGPPLRPTIFFFFVFLAFCVALWWCARTTAESAPEPEQGRGAFSRKVFYLTFEKKTRGTLGRKPDLLLLMLYLSLSLSDQIYQGDISAFFVFLLSNFCFVSNLCQKRKHNYQLYRYYSIRKRFQFGCPYCLFSSTHKHTLLYILRALSDSSAFSACFDFWFVWLFIDFLHIASLLLRESY